MLRGKSTEKIGSLHRFGTLVVLFTAYFIVFQLFNIFFDLFFVKWYNKQQKVYVKTQDGNLDLGQNIYKFILWSLV